MSWWALLIFVTLTWALGVVAGIIALWADVQERKRPADAGFSWIAIIPLVPLACFGAAMLFDTMTASWGTRVVGALHATLTVGFLVGIVRGRRRGRAAARQDN